MKISVITTHTSLNYGAALQTYATQAVLEKLGHTVEFVDYWRSNSREEGMVDKLLQKPPFSRLQGICSINAFTRKLVRAPLCVLVRIHRMRVTMPRFLRERVHFTQRRYESFEELLSDPPLADVYMTGSDQVWNSIWNDGIEKPYFLEYAPPDKPRVAFASSIGREALDEREMVAMREFLQKYRAISMREQSGVALLKQMGIESQLVPDPTLMLCADAWRVLAKPIPASKPYLLVYQLNANPQLDTYALALAKAHGLEMIRIRYRIGLRHRYGRSLLCPSVEEVLGGFFGAALVLTDSFHATAFSLNLNKPFISVLPNRFGTRIESICALTGTENRILRDFSDFAIADQPIDTARVQAVLHAEREKGYRFLREALCAQGEKQ
ncbi:MAG: polysaccharide pyruvyl transferase family protein [Clostridia bacterium]